jgi:hypothetical protein
MARSASESFNRPSTGSSGCGFPRPDIRSAHSATGHQGHILKIRPPLVFSSDNAKLFAAFIRTHLALLAGTDFFTAEVLTLRGLVAYYVLFFIHLESRRASPLTRRRCSCPHLQPASANARAVG